MAHGLAYFKAHELIEKSQGALDLLEAAVDGQGAQDNGATEAIHEALRVVLENQMRIAETLDLIKTEFDKFEEGLGKIL